MVPPSRGDLAEWLTEAWCGLTERIIVSGFYKCGFRSAECNEAGDDEDVEDQDMTALVSALENARLTDSSLGEVTEAMDLFNGVQNDIFV
jgi:hypothetical protein